MLRLVSENADDVGLVIRLNARYGSMVQTSLAVQGRLMRVQAVRQKREAIAGAATRDARALHIVEQSMLAVAEPHAARPEAARAEAAPVAVPAAGVEETVLENGTNSHGVAFETRMSAPPRSRGAGLVSDRPGQSREGGVRAPLLPFHTSHGRAKPGAKLGHDEWTNSPTPPPK